ncbi:MAG: hypothetical protein KTR25_10820 [Myxococcales bacterium]|nr:hypothetical protein [Myxococcales bacterium]
MDSSIFARRRFMILSGVLLNGVLALTTAWMVESDRPTIEASFASGLPSDMLVIRNQQAKTKVELVLDNRYVLRLAEFSAGMHGIDVQQAFRDKEHLTPDSGYVPRHLRIIFQDGEEEIVVQEEP